jgi:branched-chain amino acid transport system ATP-binding protein
VPTWENGIVLSVSNLSVAYKGLLAVQNASFEVRKGEVVSLIGSNGAGKTTILKTILGLLKPIRGEIRLNSQVISGYPTYDIVRKRISLVPEGRRLFPRLSVRDNLLLGAYTVDSRQQIAESLEMVLQLFPWVKARADQRAETLSGGEQQQVAIARALMSRPDLSCSTSPPWA